MILQLARSVLVVLVANNDDFTCNFALFDLVVFVLIAYNDDLTCKQAQYDLLDLAAHNDDPTGKLLRSVAHNDDPKCKKAHTYLGVVVAHDDDPVGLKWIFTQ